jgi:hypothetical protein
MAAGALRVWSRVPEDSAQPMPGLRQGLRKRAVQAERFHAWLSCCAPGSLPRRSSACRV